MLLQFINFTKAEMQKKLNTIFLHNIFKEQTKLIELIADVENRTIPWSTTAPSPFSCCTQKIKTGRPTYDQYFIKQKKAQINKNFLKHRQCTWHVLNSHRSRTQSWISIDLSLTGVTKQRASNTHGEKGGNQRGKQVNLTE